MISKRQQKEISALQLKKFRTENKLFLVEGEKMVEELLLSGWDIQTILATSEWLGLHRNAIKLCNELIEGEPEDLKKVSSLKTPNQVLAVVRIPKLQININELALKLALVIDAVQDPGNLGTIIRICDWFGINNIICTNSTVEAYNPKVVQASMGSIFRVNVEYTDLSKWLENYKKTIGQPVYGAFLEGENIYDSKLSSNGLIILGNESNGISTTLSKFVTNRLTIPRFTKSGADSLNVSIAAAIFCSEFRRRR